MKVVCNSTVLIALSRIQHLWLLEKQFHRLIIPPAVYSDVVIRGEGKPGAKDVAEAVWIQVQEVRDTSEVEKLSSVLHRGEAEAIVLAEEISADLVILDDGRAREIAKANELNITGTLALLHQAKGKGLIRSLKPLLDTLRSAGFYMGKEYDEILRDAGEAYWEPI